jgi:hypothetical protein
MRALVLLCLLSLAGCVWSARVESFTATSSGTFVYAAQTNTVLAPNDDGAAERLRRDWIADAVLAHAMCPGGYVIDSRRFVPAGQEPVANGGQVFYAGRCL